MRRPPNTTVLTLETLSPSELDEDVSGHRYLAKADLVVEIQIEDDDYEPPRLGVFEDAELAIILSGQAVPLESMYDTLNEAVLESLGLDLEDVATPLDDARLGQHNREAKWLETDDGERLTARLELIDRLGLEVEIPK